MDEISAMKKKVVSEMLRLKSEQFTELNRDQTSRLESVNLSDMDRTNKDPGPREKAMDEMELAADAVDALSDEIDKLKALDLSYDFDVVKPGALVKTNNGYFLVCVAHSTIDIDGNKIVGLSPEAPLYKKLQGLEPGAKFELNNIRYTIIDIR